VTGATGATGGYAVERLLERGHAVRALAHREDDRSKLLQDLGAEVVYGDLLDIHAVTAAFGGVRAAYFVGDPLRPETVKASAIFGLVAKEAGVEIVVHMSMLPSRRDTKSPVAMDHWLSERVLDFAGIPVTHLRAGIFSEWLFYVSHLIRQGRFVMPWPAEARYAPVAAEDLGRLIAEIMTKPAGHAGSTYTPVGPVLYSYREIGDVLGRALGKNLKYEQLPVDEFAPLLGMGDNDHFKGHCKETVADLQNGIHEVTNGLIGELTGRHAMNIEDFITKHKAAFV
jgi:uncharacterized protein YbjT (DUF2867 family)